MRAPQKTAGGLPQKRTGGFGTSLPAKRSVPSTSYGFFGRENHAKKDCWRKTGKCLACGSTSHSIKDYLKARSGDAQNKPSGSGEQKKTGPTGKV